MYWYRQESLWCGSLLCLLVFLGLPGRGDAQVRPPRPGAPGAAAPAAPGPPTSAQPPQPLSPDTKISLDQHRLSVDIHEQDLPSIIERITTLARIDLRHPEGIPNRRVSIRFSSLPVVDGLKRLLRVAEVPGYVLVMAKDQRQVQRLVFLAEEGSGGNTAARALPRVPQIAAAQLAPPSIEPPSPPPPPPGTPQPESTEEAKSGNVFEEIKSNAAARRLMSQIMHPNEQVRERAFEGLVRIVREDSKQRALIEFFEPLIEDLSSDDQATQEKAREEIRKLLTQQ